MAGISLAPCQEFACCVRFFHCFFSRDILRRDSAGAFTCTMLVLLSITRLHERSNECRVKDIFQLTGNTSVRITYNKRTGICLGVRVVHRSHLVDDFPSLQHVQPLRHSAILYGGVVLHFVHDHWAQGLLLNQDPCRRQPVLQAPVLVDVKVVGKGPTV